MEYNVTRALEALSSLQARANSAKGCRMRQLAVVHYRDYHLPLLAFELGPEDPGLPLMTLIGGIHGIERIGVEVCMEFLSSLLQRLRWDESLHDLLQRVRLHIVPLANPIGFCRGSRSNGEGIDLMRNAPLDAEAPVPLLVGGQRLSRYLPWYRGQAGRAMAIEASTLLDYVQRHQQHSPFQLVLDCHSGFGLKDYLWFPFAGSSRPYPWLSELTGLIRLFKASYPSHQHYHISPQHHHYTTHGDLWDHLCHQHRQPNPLVVLTLEMGSWLWVKKNPRQLLSYAGLFNPLPRHRHQRVLRRHAILIEFLLHATAAYRNWRPSRTQACLLEAIGMRHWYPQEAAQP